MKTVNFGVIGCGLMGKEFASAAARWCHLLGDIAQPVIVGVCDTNKESMKWFSDHVPSVKYMTEDYKELLAKEDIEAIYCALPHNLHGNVYSDIIAAGKHLLGEKPFGMDQEANEKILTALKNHPDVIARCASEFPFYPACQLLYKWVKEGRFGRIIEAKCGCNHSSDMDLSKPINWKRMVEINGEYGCMGDLGIHTQHIPFRLGWRPQNVYAVLSNIATERYNAAHVKVPCETWDNATVICQMQEESGNTFPMQFEMKRMAPTATNQWFIEIYGLDFSAKFSTDDANAIYFTENLGREQGWCRVSIGAKPIFPTITGDIFEFGFTDAMLQMWAAFIMEIEGKQPVFGCFTPEESALSHKMLTAALMAHKEKRVIDICENS